MAETPKPVTWMVGQGPFRGILRLPFSAAPFALAARYRNCMSGSLSIVLWLGLVLIGIGSMRWGPRAADLLDILRGHWGLPAIAGGTLMGLATASPEIAVNVTSVVFG